MIFKTAGNPADPAILFFHAMGVTADSSMPTSAVYCAEQKYISKTDEIRQVLAFLKEQKITKLCLIVTSSLCADLAISFITETEVPVDHVFFDGGQFAQINKSVRRTMTPFLDLAIKSLYWSNGKTLKQILWCDDEQIRPYFIETGKNLTYGNLHAQLSDSLENKPFPSLSKQEQEHTFFSFGSIEDHFKYRDNVMKSYLYSHYPVFDQYDHMQYQIRDPKGFAEMLIHILDKTVCPLFHSLNNKERHFVLKKQFIKIQTGCVSTFNFLFSAFR